MKGLILSGIPMAFLVLLAAGCGGADDVTGPPVADLSGEYTYQVTGGGGTCTILPRDTGVGVYRITQAKAWAKVCWLREACDGESCHEGPVNGNTFEIDRVWDSTQGTCVWRTKQHIRRTRDDDGLLYTRFDMHWEYVEGDCSALTLPCDAWQTAMATPCATPCYDSYCGSVAAKVVSFQ